MASGSPFVPCPLRRCSLFRRVAWRPRDAIVAIVFALLLVTVGVVCMLVPQKGIFVWNLGDKSFVCFVAAGVAAEFGLLLGVPLWLVRKRDVAPNPKPWTAGFLAKEFLIAIPITVGALVVVAVVALSAQYLLLKLAVPAESPREFWGHLSLRFVIPLMVIAVAVAPVVEEVFFRGFLYNTLRRVCPVWLAVLLQAGLFGFCHLYEPLGVVVTFALGVLLAGIYEWRKTLLANILVHGMYNAIVAIAVFAIVWTNADAPAIGIICSPEAKGQVVVERSLRGSPAEKADIRPGDVLAKYGGAEVTDYQQLIQSIHGGKVGDAVSVEILRGPERMTKRVIVSSRREIESKTAGTSE